MKTPYNHNFKDITGQIFTRLTIIKFDKIKKKRTYWLCRCECGTIKSIQRNHLISGVIKSCGCYQREYLFNDLTGQVFMWLTVLKFDKIKRGNSYWLCKCKCGIVKSIQQSNLISNKSQSCGCLKTILLKANHKTHGMVDTRIYGIWAGMKNRCLSPTNAAYKDYGGRGITVCKRWLKFENFMEDMYPSYLKHVAEFGEKETTLDRWPNVNGNYELGNVRWATNKEQSFSKRTSVQSENYAEHIYWKQKLTGGLRTVSAPKCKRSFITEYLGCSVEVFHKYFASKFQLGMTWKNNGRGKGTWQIDHIIGCNNFDLSKEEDRKKCFHYKNLRPMWYEDHIKKSRKRIV